jgi:riboflavin kinase/FMN adenylyltransferase
METIAFENYNLSYERPILTIGMFDGVHLGHRSLLEELVCSAHSVGVKAVVVSFLQHPRQVLNATDNGFALLQDSKKRAEGIASCGVDCLLWLDFTKEMAAMEADEFLDMLIEKVNPCEVLLGYDNRFGKKGSRVFDEIISNGNYKDIKVRRSDCRVLCEMKEVSSTQIRKALQEGNVSLATKMLSVPYVIGGVVESGRQIGRQIGFPTANIKLDRENQTLKKGVYGGKVVLDGETFKAIINLGNRPTFDLEESIVEAHLLGFDGVLYDKEIKIEFIKYLRDVVKFTDVDTLKKQLEEDKISIGEMDD